MWAVSTKFNPAGDLVQIPNLYVQDLDPASEPPGITDKIIIDATTPLPPDLRGHFDSQVTDPAEAEEWTTRLTALWSGN